MLVLKASRTAQSEWRESWKIPAISALGTAAAVTAVYSLGSMMPAIQASTGWSRAQISSGPTIITVATILFGPSLGALVDRVGSRHIALVGLVIFCAALGALGLVSSNIVSWWLGWGFVAAGYLAIKPTVWATAVVRHFEKHRGLALGVALSGTGIGSSISPITVTLLSAEFGWRGAYMWFAAGIAIIILPTVFFFFHDRPALARDPESAATSRGEQPAPTGRFEIIRSRRYLLMALACLTLSVPITALSFHFVPIAIANGFSPASSALVASLLGAGTIVGRLGAGVLLDRVKAHLLGVAACGSALAAIALLYVAPSLLPTALAAALLGLAAGSELDVLAYLISRYFSARYFGFLFGVMSTIITFAIGMGPLLAGVAFDYSGDYYGVMTLSAGTLVFAAACFSLLGSPSRPDGEPS